MVQHLKVLMPEPVLNISLAASEVVVHHKHVVPVHHESVHQVGANKPGTTRDQDSLLIFVGSELYIRVETCRR